MVILGMFASFQNWPCSGCFLEEGLWVYSNTTSTLRVVAVCFLSFRLPPNCSLPLQFLGGLERCGRQESLDGNIQTDGRQRRDSPHPAIRGPHRGANGHHYAKMPTAVCSNQTEREMPTAVRIIHNPPTPVTRVKRRVIQLAAPSGFPALVGSPPWTHDFVTASLRASEVS